jgi:RNA polymerase sigma factor (sigma-70 family)
VKNSIKDRAYWLDVWTRFNTGDRVAFSEIYEEFIDSLFAYGYKISHDREMVKDCIQDIFLDLHRLRPNLKNPEYIEFYLFKSLKNAIFHKLQKNNMLQSMPLDDTGNYDFKFEVEQDVSELESDLLRLEKLKSILATLDPQKRELLYLKFNSGLNYHEIGQILNMQSDTVKKQIYRLIDQIRGKYGTQLFELLVIR